MNIKNNNRGQSTVEYVLLMTAVVAVIIAFVSTSNSGFKTQLNSTLNTVTSDIGSMSELLTASHASTSAPTGATAGMPPYSVISDSGV